MEIKKEINNLVQSYENAERTETELIGALLFLVYEEDIPNILNNLAGKYREKFLEKLHKLNNLKYKPEDYFSLNDEDNLTPKIVRKVREWSKEKEKKEEN